MINLIPPHAKKQVKTEYWVRVFSVWGLLAAIACLIIVLLLIPTYVLVRAELKVYEGLYQTASIQNDSYGELEHEVGIANEIAVRLSSIKSQITVMELIEVIEDAARGNVEITNISLVRTEGKIGSISVAGEAYSRETLSGFRNTLEDHEFFNSVKLPISNLAKDKDVPFNIEIITTDVITEDV
ncbi:MAG: hypothetical protein ACI92I_000953 [Acidimicrobiales bacterium]|jgi:hypothetical protein